VSEAFLPYAIRHTVRTPGGLTRHFVGEHKEAKFSNYAHVRGIDMSDMWMTVFTNEDDTEITEVQCGITKT
jgi:hypothetical protein